MEGMLSLVSYGVGTLIGLIVLGALIAALPLGANSAPAVQKNAGEPSKAVVSRELRRRTLTLDHAGTLRELLTGDAAFGGRTRQHRLNAAASDDDHR